jgi:hypothetical protein
MHSEWLQAFIELCKNWFRSFVPVLLMLLWRRNCLEGLTAVSADVIYGLDFITMVHCKLILELRYKAKVKILVSNITSVLIIFLFFFKLFWHTWQKINLLYKYGSISGLYTVFYWSIYQSLCQSHTVLTTYKLCSRSLSHVGKVLRFVLI